VPGLQASALPVTAKLSREFYDRLGDDIANELVNRLNDMDLTYRNELRELNELTFARLDARVGERLAELRADLKVELAEGLAVVRKEFTEGLAQVRLEAGVSETRLLRWMFGFWIGTALVIIGSRLAL